MYELNGNDGQIIIFFITFKPNTLERCIANSQLAGHQLMLIKQDSDFAIELTEMGSKINLKREHLLTSSEQYRILANKDVPETLWQLIDIIDQETINQAEYSIFRDTGIVFVAFILGILLTFVVFIKHQK